MKQYFTEEMNIQEEWYKEAEGMTLDKLPDFINQPLFYFQSDLWVFTNVTNVLNLKED